MIDEAAYILHYLQQRFLIVLIMFQKLKVSQFSIFLFAVLSVYRYTFFFFLYFKQAAVFSQRKLNYDLSLRVLTSSHMKSIGLVANLQLIQFCQYLNSTMVISNQKFCKQSIKLIQYSYHIKLAFIEGEYISTRQVPRTLHYIEIQLQQLTTYYWCGIVC